jgi:osmotically-inducible protein OsmY
MQPFSIQENQSMQDSIIKQNVSDELAWRPDIGATNIGVSVKDGVVTLSGFVATYTEKSAAEAAVKQVAGVRGVAEELEIRYTDLIGTHDDEIARRALNAISWHSMIPKNRVTVEVENGWVTLTGSLDWQYQKADALDAVRNLYGVKGVTNDITLKVLPQPADIKKRIEAALKRNAELDSETIRVAVADGIVTLEGSVDSWNARDRAEGAAWAAPGVKTVNDHLVVY